MGHIRGTSRCARRGSASLTPLAKALAKFGFFAPLTEDVFLDKGYGAASFTRATTATVVDHEGAIRNCVSGEVRFAGQRRVRNRVATEDFSNANWSVTGTATKVGNASITGPDGTTVTAMEVSFGATASSLFYNSVTGITGHTAVLSCWVRAKSGSTTIRMTANNAFTSNITVTETWQRLSASEVYAGGSTSSVVANNSSGTSGNVYVYHPQLEIFSPSSSNQNPSEYVSVGANLLNELTYTEEIDNAAWTKTGSTVTGGQATGPLGGANVADLFVEAATSTQHYLGKVTASIANGTALVCSIYAKKGPGATAPDWIQLAGGGSISATAYANFNLTTGLVGSSSGCTASMVSVGDGWYRLIMALSTTSTATASFFPCFTNNNDGLGRIPTYLGVVTSNVYVYGAQVEKGSAVTTYFPVGSVYPYHGACVDGVRYFSTLNGNTVASYIVTEATGAAITRPENDGLTNGLVLPNVSGNSASITDAGAILGSGDVDLRGTLTPSAWNSAAQQAVAFKTNSFEFGIGGGGAFIYFWFSLDGGVSINTFKTVSGVSFSDASTGWVRVTREKATGDVKFYESADGVAWTQVGATQTSTAGVAVGGNANQLYFGIANSTRGIIGVLSRAQLRSAIGGTTVFDADFSAQALGTTTFTESSSNAATVTINRSGAVPAYIGNPLRLFNYDGYLAESARTNLVLQSSNFGTTWAAVGTPTRSAAAAYCGEVALDLIGDDAGSVEGYSQIVAFTGNATKSVSFLVKQGTSTSTVAVLQDSAGPTNLLIVAITWSGGVPVVTYTTGSAERASEYMGNGVWRIFCLTASVTAASTNTLYFYPATTAAFATGNTGDIYIGGVQAENATTASVSHIPTTTATVTRNADDLRYSAAGNILGTVGSAYAEAPSGTGPNISGRFVDSAGTGVPLMRSGGTGAVLGFNDGATTVTIGTLDGGFSTTPYKVACAWGSSLVSGAVNGTLDSANAFDGDATLTTAISPGGAASVGLEAPIRNVRVSVQKISDADLQLITQ